jgi:hypothetical protein
LPQGLLVDEKKKKLPVENNSKGFTHVIGKRRRDKEKYSWMSLGWLRFFGTSVNEEEKENSCGLCAEKFFTRTKYSSS